MKFALALAAGVLVSSVALASEVRTVSWYVAHPGALAAVTAACKNDPGHGRHSADCWNADEARIELNLRSPGHVDMTPPSDPHYWSVHPDQLAQRLLICHRMPAQYQAANFCPSAFAAGGGR